jgi:peptidylprolyl isomerase
MFKEKDFIYIEYTAKLEDSGEVIDTTNPEIAKKFNIFDPDREYGPQLVILGEHRIIRGLEEALYNLELEKEVEIKIPPEKGYGLRDPNKIKIVSLGELKRQGITPYPNLGIRLIDGSYAIVKSVSGGRVILDLNHPLAGKTLVYNVRVVKILQTEIEKIQALLNRWFGKKSLEEINIDLKLSEEKTIKFNISKNYYRLEDLQYRKRMLAYDIIKYVVPDAKVIFIEEYDKSMFA